jgi:hypothetical protein
MGGRRRLTEQPRQTLHEAGPGRHAEQHSAVHFFARRELGETLRESLGRDRHGDWSRPVIAIPRLVNVVWHADGMPEDDCPTVSDSQGPSRVRNG